MRPFTMRPCASWVCGRRCCTRDRRSWRLLWSSSAFTSPGRRSRGASALAGGLTVIALLGFATPAMALFFVGRGFHMSTALYALLAFAALRRGRFGLGWFLAVVLLAAGMLGDLLACCLRP